MGEIGSISRIHPSEAFLIAISKQKKNFNRIEFLFSTDYRNLLNLRFQNDLSSMTSDVG